MLWDNAFSQQMMELFNESFEDLKLERSIKQQLTKEEIQKLSIDETLTPTEKLEYIFKNGQDIQRLYALKNLEETIQSLSKEHSGKMFVLIDDMMTNKNPRKDVVILTAQVMCQIIRNGLVDRKTIVSHFFRHMLTNLKSKDKEVCSAWLEFLVAAMKLFIPEDTKKIIAFLGDHISLTSSSITRHLCCKIVSHLVEFVDREIIVSYLIPKMRALCQDIEMEIRSQMCIELENMISHCSKEITEKYVVPELLMLFEDEEATVRGVALSTLVNTAPSLDPEYLKSISMTSLIVQFYEKALHKKNPEDLITAAKCIGKVLSFLKSYLSEEEKSSLLASFQTLCSQGVIQVNSSFESDASSLSFTNSMGVIDKYSSSHHDDGKNEKDSQCRYWCAYNFPAVLCSIATGSFKTLLLPSFVLLAQDQHAVVRRTMASCIHEIGCLLSRDVHFTFNSLRSLLQDADVEVLDAVLSHLPELLNCFLNDKVPQSYICDLIPILISCEKELTKTLQWRTQEKLLIALSCLHKHIPSDQIYTNFVPMLQNILVTNHVRPVKLAAGHTLLIFLKYNNSPHERNEICKKLVSDLVLSRRSRTRLLFIDLCYIIADLFSKAFFKDHFYDVAMLISSDDIINVRLKFCKMLPLLKSQIKLPSDRLLLQTLEQTVRRIMALEKDPDVSATIRKIITELDSVRLTIDSAPLNKDDIIDRAKELDEKLLHEHIPGHDTGSVPDKGCDPLLKRSRKSIATATILKDRKASITALPKKTGSNSKTVTSSKSAVQSSSHATGQKLATKKSSPHTMTKRTK